MDQTIINWLLAGFSARIGFLLNAVWQAVKDLQTTDKVLAEKVSSIEVLVAGPTSKKTSSPIPSKRCLPSWTRSKTKSIERRTKMEALKSR